MNVQEGSAAKLSKGYQLVRSSSSKKRESLSNESAGAIISHEFTYTNDGVMQRTMNSIQNDSKSQRSDLRQRKRSVSRGKVKRSSLKSSSLNRVQNILDHSSLNKSLGSIKSAKSGKSRVSSKFKKSIKRLIQHTISSSQRQTNKFIERKSSQESSKKKRRSINQDISDSLDGIEQSRNQGNKFERMSGQTGESRKRVDFSLHSDKDNQEELFDDLGQGIK